MYLEISAVQKIGDLTPNRAFKNIGEILIRRRVHEACATIMLKMLVCFYFVDANIAKSPLYQLYGSLYSLKGAGVKWCVSFTILIERRVTHTQTCSQDGGTE